MKTQQRRLKRLMCVLAAVAMTGNLQAQTRNDELYRSIAEGETRQLVLSLDSGMSPDGFLLVPDSDQAAG